MFSDTPRFMPFHVRVTCPKPWHSSIKNNASHKPCYAMCSYGFSEFKGEGGHIYLKAVERALSIPQLDETKQKGVQK
jgi:hypothetical protein